MKQATLKRKSFKTWTIACCCIAALSMMISCSKSNTPPRAQGETAQFTITITGATSQDAVSVALVGVAGNQSKTIWKVNGVVQDNQTSLSLTEDQFTGNTQTYVIESTTPLQTIALDISCLGSSTHNYTLSYKAVINGQVKNNEQNITVSNNNDYNKDFSY